MPTREQPARRGRPPRTVAVDADLRQLLTRAAALEIRDHGFHATTTARIAARAGLSAGVFYNYFRDKTDVLLAAYADWLTHEWERIDALLPQPVRGDRRQIGAVVAAIVDLHSEWIRLRQAVATLARDEQRVAHARIESRRWQVDRIARLLGRRPGKALRAQVVLRLLAIEAAADSIATGEQDALDIDVRALKRELTDLLMQLAP